MWFDADEFDDHLDRAVDAAATMPRNLAALPAGLTGGRRLKVSVGVHTGSFHPVLAGSSQQALCLCGPDVSLLATLQDAAPPGAVAVSAAVASAVPPQWVGDPVGPGSSCDAVAALRPSPPRPSAGSTVPAEPATAGQGVG